MEYLWIIFLVVALALRVGLVVWAYKVGEKKGKGTTGLLLGLFLGWIGLIIIYALTADSAATPATPSSPPFSSSTSTINRGTSNTYSSTSTSRTIQCKHCSRKAPADARFCPYCGHLLYD
jgi:hypothetical protein